MKKLDFKDWEDLRSTLGVDQTTLDSIKRVLHEHLKKEKEKEKAGSEADGWLAASSSSSARSANPTQPEIAAEGSKKRKKQDNSDEFPQWIQAKFATSSYARADMRRQYKVRQPRTSASAFFFDRLIRSSLWVLLKTRAST